jgi:hypothetical protein
MSSLGGSVGKSFPMNITVEEKIKGKIALSSIYEWQTESLPTAERRREGG